MHSRIRCYISKQPLSSSLQSRANVDAQDVQRQKELRTGQKQGWDQAWVSIRPEEFRVLEEHKKRSEIR